MKINVLFYGLSPNHIHIQSYLNILLANYLAKNSNYHIYYFGPHVSNSIHVHPNIKYIDVETELVLFRKSSNLKCLDTTKDILGVDYFHWFIKNLKPNYIFISSDLLTSSRLINEINFCSPKYLSKTFVYLYLDYKCPHLELLNIINKADKIITYTHQFNNHLAEIGIPLNKLITLRPSLDTHNVYRLNKSHERKKLQLDDNDFIIINYNSNSYKSGLDITLQIFFRVYKIIPSSHLKLILLQDSNQDYSIQNIIKIICIELNLDSAVILNNNILFINDLNNFNLYYNIADIGINTCLGEGVNLCNLEHALLGKPQIVPDITGIGECGFHNIPISTNFYLPRHSCKDGGLAEVVDINEFVNKLVYFFNNRNDLDIEGQRQKKYIKENFIDTFHILEKLFI